MENVDLESENRSRLNFADVAAGTVVVRSLVEDVETIALDGSATPHSGVEGAFRSLLSLLRPEFAEWDTSTLKEKQRIELARHYVQRTRRDIEQGWEEERCFPDREPADVTYKLSKPYRELFDAVYDFCTRLVTAGPDDRRRRARAVLGEADKSADQSRD